MSDDASTRLIAREWIVFLVICLLAGGAFVVFRVARIGPQVLTPTPHAR